VIYQDRCCDVLKTWFFDKNSDGFMPGDLELILGTAIPTLAAIFGLFWGTHTYRESQVLKRKEIVFPLMDEFDESEKMEVAKRILDDFSGIKKRFLDPKKIKTVKPEGYYHKHHLDEILRFHRVPDDDDKDRENLCSFDDGESEIRHSFDTLLAFLSKLEYLRKIQLIREEDLCYFRYYINKAAENKDVRAYVKDYDFQLGDGLLHEAFKRTRAGSGLTEKYKKLIEPSMMIRGHHTVTS
jgi:hypothetical protein